MLLFLYGEDNYRLKQKLKMMKDKYLDTSSTDANFVVLSSEENKNFEKIKNNIEAMPFLAEKRLIILENFLKLATKGLQEEIKDYSNKIPDTTIVIFIEEGLPDKRKGLFKALKKKAERVWQFDPLRGASLEKWIKDKVADLGGRIEPQAVTLLASYVGSDLWQMKNEIEKLILYKNKVEIKTSDIELLVKAKLNTNIFNLIDVIGYKNSQKSTDLLEQILASGENEIYVLTMIIYQFRNIIIVKDLLENGANQAEVSKKTRMHPYVLGKTITQAKNYTLPRLKEIYERLADNDLAIKTGKIEPHLALNLLITELTK